MKTRHSKSTRRTTIIMLVVGHLLAAAAHATDAIDSEARNAVAPAATTTVLGTTSVEAGTETIYKPTISTKVSVKNRQKISDAFELALERVYEVPECSELFAKLDAEGTATLGRVIFLPIGRAQARGDVCRGVSAYTMVGGGPVRVCRIFRGCQIRRRQWSSSTKRSTTLGSPSTRRIPMV